MISWPSAGAKKQAMGPGAGPHNQLYPCDTCDACNNLIGGGGDGGSKIEL